MQRSDASSVSTASSAVDFAAHNVWKPMMEQLFHVQIGCIFELFVEEIDSARVAFSCHSALNVLRDMAGIHGSAWRITEYLFPWTTAVYIRAPLPLGSCSTMLLYFDYLSSMYSCPRRWDTGDLVTECWYKRSTPEGKELTTCGTEAPLRPDVLRDVPDETVKAFVGCLGTATFLAIDGFATCIDVLHGPSPGLSTCV